MDFLDPKKQKRHARRLALGYALIGLTLMLATTILVYRAWGYDIDRKDNVIKVIQNGLVFFSSHPDNATVFVNGQKYKDHTNSRMTLPAGDYTIEIQKTGYDGWKRNITVKGGDLERFDYPFLWPSTLVTGNVKQYSAAPTLATTSPDRRWLMVQAGDPNQFDLYDLNTASATAKPTSKGVAVPSDIVAAGTTTTGWQLTQWSSDNRHVVLKRLYQKSGQAGAEYILFDRQEPSLSQNLSVALGFTPTILILRNLAFDQYFAFDQNSGEVFTASLKKPTPQPYLSGVLAFAADHDLSIYATAQGAPNGKVLIRLKRGDDAPQTLRQAPLNTNYLIALARYGDTPYVAAGSTSEGRVYVYKDPMATLTKEDKMLLVPAEILRAEGGNYMTFAPNARYVLLENGDKMAVYDVETEKYYAYQPKITFDAPQTHVVWMDGFRLSLISNGKLTVFDFDGANQHTLAPASPNYLPFFDRQYRFSYNLTAGNVLTSTPLLVTQDL